MESALELDHEKIVNFLKEKIKEIVTISDLLREILDSVVEDKAFVKGDSYKGLFDKSILSKEAKKTVTIIEKYSVLHFSGKEKGSEILFCVDESSKTIAVNTDYLFESSYAFVHILLYFFIYPQKRTGILIERDFLHKNMSLEKIFIFCVIAFSKVSLLEMSLLLSTVSGGLEQIAAKIALPEAIVETVITVLIDFF